MALPAWNTAGSPVKTSLTASGWASMTHGGSPPIRIVNASPWRAWARTMNGPGRVIQAAVCTARGRRGPGGRAGMGEPIRRPGGTAHEGGSGALRTPPGSAHELDRSPGNGACGPRIELAVAVCQLAPAIGDLDGNRARALAALDAAADAGAQVVVLPELAASGYVFRDAAEARGLAEAPDGPTVAGWAERAAARGIVVAGGFAEAGRTAGCSTAPRSSTPAACAPSTARPTCGTARPRSSRPGPTPPPVVDTPHGRIGLMVCYDLEFPEWVRLAALAGAELLCVPTNWPREARPDGERPMEVLRAMVAASTNRMAIAVCDRCGSERGVDWVAGSAIAGARRLAARRPDRRGRAGAAARGRRPRGRARQGARAAQRRARRPPPGPLCPGRGPPVECPA